MDEFPVCMKGKINKSKVVQRCLYSYRQRYSSSQWSNVAPRESTTNFDFLPQYTTPKKVYISERDQNQDTKKEQALSITFSDMIDLFPKMGVPDWLLHCVTN